MKKLLSIFLTFAFIFMTSLNVFAQNKETPDITKNYEKAIDEDLYFDYSDASSLISVLNGSDDITLNSSFEIVNNASGDIGRLKINKSYIQSLSPDTYYITVNYNTVAGGTGKQVIGLTITASTAPSVIPSTLTYSGSDIEFDYTVGSGLLISNIIKDITYEGNNLGSNYYSYSSINQKLIIKSSFFNGKTGSVKLYIVFDNIYSTKSEITINISESTQTPNITADIVSSLNFGITKTADTNYYKEYKFIRSDNQPFPFSEFDSQIASSILNVNGPFTATITKDQSDNAILKISPNNASTLVNYSFDIKFTKKSTSETDTKTFSGQIMTNPSTIPDIIKTYNDYTENNNETFDNQLANFTFNIYNNMIKIEYYGLLNGKYDFNFKTGADSNFLQKHSGEVTVVPFKVILFPERQLFPSVMTVRIKNIENYTNPVLYKMNSDGTLSEIVAIYDTSTKLFSFSTTKLDYGYLVSSGVIHNANDTEIGSNYGVPQNSGNNGSNPGNNNSGNNGNGNNSGNNSSNDGNNSNSGNNSSGSNSGNTENPNNNPDTGLIDLSSLWFSIIIAIVLLLIIKRKNI